MILFLSTTEVSCLQNFISMLLSRKRAQRISKRKHFLFLGLDSSKFEILKKKIKIRDEQDKNRVIAPLRKAKDAIYLDSSEMNQA